MFAPELLVPMGDEAVPMCWLCAHHVVEHETPMDQTSDARCECLPWEIYPDRAPVVDEGDVIAVPSDFCLEHGDVDRTKMQPGDWMTGHFYNPASKTIDTHVRGEVVAKFDLDDNLVERHALENTGKRARINAQRRCGFCHELGHIVKTCPELRKKTFGGNQK